ncbi:MAG: gamma-glutamyl-gamma-aminobutyrate hydrolase family protein, partial [Planctomycetota bacterium]
VQELQRLTGAGGVRVVRGADARVEDVLRVGTTGVLIGPGPGEPRGSGVSEAVIQARLGASPGDRAAPPIVGVCLGMQALATATGARLRRATELVHGAVRDVEHQGEGLFEGLARPFPMARYNSLVVDEETLAECWQVTARTADGDIAGLRHRNLPLEGVQGHPESILTVDRGGRDLLASFVGRCRP